MPQRSLFEVQINGFSGVDFQQPELPLADLRRAVDALAAHQTLRFFLTLITDSLPALAAKLQNLERLRQLDPALHLALGVAADHLNGPGTAQNHPPLRRSQKCHRRRA